MSTHLKLFLPTTQLQVGENTYICTILIKIYVNFSFLFWFQGQTDKDKRLDRHNKHFKA